MNKQPTIITINGCNYSYYNAFDALKDEEFRNMIDTCKYQDTGGGWRETYKVLRDLIKEYIEDAGYEIESKSIFPKIYVSRWYL